MRTILMLWSVLLLVLLSRQTYGQTPDAALIRAERVKSNQAILSRDLPTLTGTMLPEMQVTAGSGRHIAGRDSVRALFASTFADREFLDYVRTTDSVQVSTLNPLAAEHGYWVGRWQRPDGIQIVRGTYLAMWHRTETGWKLRSELFVSLSCAGSKTCNQ
ncbi:MAG: nuclear transport factor 2 family protein [Bacteroidetes bacterium]|nr:nuclear transport factor 2 family protein [Fibrella sp.]